jgi:hypothetical protein
MFVALEVGRQFDCSFRSKVKCSLNAVGAEVPETLRTSVIIRNMNRSFASRKKACPGEEIRVYHLTWYLSRLELISRRRKLDEMLEIFAWTGLTGDFWNPEADVFG